MRPILTATGAVKIDIGTIVPINADGEPGEMLKRALAANGMAKPDPFLPDPDPTLDQIYDAELQNSRIVKALVLAINDGSLTVGGNRNPAQLRAIIKAKM